MDLDDADIREFADLWKQEFDETLSLDEARYQASLLMELYEALASPLPCEQSPATQPSVLPQQCDTSSTVENPAKTKTARYSP